MGCVVNDCSFKHSLRDLCHKHTRHANDYSSRNNLALIRKKKSISGNAQHRKVPLLCVFTVCIDLCF